MPLENGQIILVDTNVIIEAHRLGCWNSLADFFNLETVEMCMEETQTGFQRRNPEEKIDSINLKNSLAAIHSVSQEEETIFLLDNDSATMLDPGELHLLVHAGKREDAWILNSPDKAAMRFACDVGWSERIISLENMIKRVNANTSSPLRQNFTENWLIQEKTKILMKMF